MTQNNTPGSRELTRDELDVVLSIREAERMIVQVHRSVQAHHRLHPEHYGSEEARQLSVARVDFENAFMRLVRAVARPASPWLAS